MPKPMVHKMIAEMLDCHRLGSYLESKIPGFCGLKSILKFEGGQSNPTYLLACESGRYVLRRKPAGKLLKSAHAIDREFRVMRALTDSDVPVPEMLHLCEDSDVIGTDFYVMAYVSGCTFWDPALPEFDNAVRTEIYDQMNKVLVSIHNVDINMTGLSDYGRPGNYFDRQYNRWVSQYRASETETVRTMEDIITWLGENMVADDGQMALVHGDFRLDNLLFAPKDGKILAVLDWELSTLGHPFSDIAFQCALLRMPPDTAIKGLGDIDRKGIGIPSEEDYLASYCRGMGIQSINNWTFYLVFSLFRMAAIVQGVRKRALDGNASNSQAYRVGALVTPLVELATDLIPLN